MTFSVFSLFFLIFLSSSVHLVQPTGLKVRITNQGLDFVKTVAVEFLQKLVGKKFADIPVEGKTISGLNLQDLSPGQVSLSFLQGQGLQLEMDNLRMAGRLTYDNKNMGFEATGLKVTMQVKLNRDQDHLVLQFLECQSDAEKIQIKPDSGANGAILKIVTTFKKKLFENLFKEKVCPAVENNCIPVLNQKVAELMRAMQPFEGLNVRVDFSLSGDVVVTPDSLDVPLRGLDTVNDQEPDPVITESQNMVYVAVTEVFLNGVAEQLYNAGVLNKDMKVTHWALWTPLKVWQLVRRPMTLLEPLNAHVEVTDVPHISISRAEGLRVTVRVGGQVSPQTPGSEAFASGAITVTCGAKVKVDSGEGFLTFRLSETSCTTDSKVPGLAYFVKGKVEEYLQGQRVPLPFGVCVQSEVSYNDMFLVVGGTLYLEEHVKEELLEAFNQQIGFLFIE